jgi:hypothetical protein
VVCWNSTNIMKKHFASVIRAEEVFFSPVSYWSLACLIPGPWRWRRNVPPKRRLTFNRLHNIMYQKPELITTSVRISNLKEKLRWCELLSSGTWLCIALHYKYILSHTSKNVFDVDLCLGTKSQPMEMLSWMWNVLYVNQWC